MATPLALPPPEKPGLPPASRRFAADTAPSSDSSEHGATRRLWLQRVVIACVLLGVVIGLTVAARSLLDTSEAPRRQVAKIAILPDTPPPPPPPPKEEPKKEPPKEETRQQVQQEVPKVQDTPPPPANEPIKMEGAAGDGPSAFGSGTVTNEYKTGAPVVGPASSGPSGTASDRAAERFYANSARQLLREAIEKNLRADAGELTATFAIWVEDDGSIRRFELTPSGDSARDGDMRSALDGTSKTLRLPPPSGLTQPLRFRLTVRPVG
jgi:periplasmic protein TonB